MTLLNKLTRSALAGAVALTILGVPVGAAPDSTYLLFDGDTNYVEVPDSTDYSASTTGALTVSTWMRPDVLTFRNTEDRTGTSGTSRYVHWLGKGEGSGPTAQQEWTFRMYSDDNTQGRGNRISFYVFNLSEAAGVQNEGVGSYYQPGYGRFVNDPPFLAGEWIHVVGVADGERTRIYINGDLKACNRYTGAFDPADGCPIHYYASGHPYYPNQIVITPQHGTAPLRMAHRDRNSFFEGGLSKVRMWNRALRSDEVAALSASDIVPADGPAGRLVGQWLLNDGSGTVARDSASGRHGTIFGATWFTDLPLLAPAGARNRRAPTTSATTTTGVASLPGAPATGRR
jgi:hypothetical protein